MYVITFSALMALAFHGSMGISMELRMPGIAPNENDHYFCTSVEVDPLQAQYITGFTPHANMNMVHHMMLYGCSAPGRRDKVWRCRELSGSTSNLETGPCAQGTSKILYGWARNAPKTKLPKGIGFKVGGDTDVNYLVLQVHYMHTDKDDNSGVAIQFTTTPQQKRAGVLLITPVTGSMSPNSEENFDGYCEITADVVLHPLAFRPHTHRHGTVVSGWRVRGDQWALLGKKDPQLPQRFYEVQDQNLVIQKGDIIATRCHMVNNENRTVSIGWTADEEMCNFYLMYWFQGDSDVNESVCFSFGPPIFRLENTNLKNIPTEQMLKP